MSIGWCLAAQALPAKDYPFPEKRMAAQLECGLALRRTVRRPRQTVIRNNECNSAGTQDRNVGDFGDFAEIGLLRAVRGDMRLGVARHKCSHKTSAGAGNGTLARNLWDQLGWRSLGRFAGKRRIGPLGTSGVRISLTSVSQETEFSGIHIQVPFADLCSPPFGEAQECRRHGSP